MDPTDEILQIVKEIRQAQIDARKTQLDAVQRSRRLILLGGIFFAILTVAYIVWCWVVVTHTTLN